jgi:hypothetical protein
MQLRMNADNFCFCYRLRVEGLLFNAQGRSAQVTIAFTFWNGANWQWVPSDPQQRTYVLNNGAAGTWLDFQVTSNAHDLGTLSLQIPYSAFMLTSRPGVPYSVRATAFLYMDNVQISRSPDVDFQFAR